MGGENLNVAPGETHEFRIKVSHGFMECLGALRPWEERQIKDTLAHIWPATMNKISEIGDPGWIHFFAGEKNVENGVHDAYFIAT